MRTWTSALGALMLLPAVIAQSGAAGPDAGDWPRYARDRAGTHYSPLRQIHTGNVKRLRPAFAGPHVGSAGRPGCGILDILLRSRTTHDRHRQ